MYFWLVVFSNDKQGFRKTFEVRADDMVSAAQMGEEALVAKGYELAKFNLIEIKRGRAVGS
jgi:hypothetical protein